MNGIDRKRLPILTLAVWSLGLILVGVGGFSDIAARWWIGASGLLLVGLVAAKESILWRWRREQLREELAGQQRRAEQALAAERKRTEQALAAERKRAEQLREERVSEVPAVRAHALIPITPPMRDLPPPPEPGAPEVSVVVPAHDDGLYLDTCLASVHRQNFGAWECIVVDDASVDDTLAVALRWAGRDDRFRIVRHDRNLGLAATRNTAVARARGRYVTLLDGDDFLFQDGLRSRLAGLAGARDPAIAGSWCDWEMVPAGAGLDHVPQADRAPRVLDYATGRGENQFIATVPLLRTEVVRSLGGFDVTFLSAEDYEFWTRLFRNGFKLVGVAGRRVAYRQKHTSLIAAYPLAHLRNVHRVYDYLARTLDPEAVCALAPAPLVEPPGGPDPDGVADRLISFLTFAVLAGDPRQIDGVRGFLAGGPPVRHRVRSAVAFALERHALRVGGLAAEEKRRVLDEVSSAVAKPAPERPALPPHHGRIDLSRVALDAPLPPHGVGARRRALRTGPAAGRRAPWEVILDPETAAGAVDLLLLGRELVEEGRSVAFLDTHGDPDLRWRAQAEGVAVVERADGPAALVVTSSPGPPRAAAAAHVALCAEPWVPCAAQRVTPAGGEAPAAEAPAAARPAAVLVRNDWEARRLAGQRGLYAGGWLSRPPRLLPPARTGAVLVLRAPGAAPGRDAASVRRRYGATLDLVFGPGLDAPRRLLVTAARVPVVAPCVRAAVVVGNAVPMDAVVAGTPVLVLGAPPPHPFPGGVEFTTFDRLGDAVRAARPAPPVPTPADALDRCLDAVRAHLPA